MAVSMVADKLPKLLVIKPVGSSGYASYKTEGGYVFCGERSVFSPLAKIEVERAEVDGKYVHLRFYQSNKYWARKGPGVDDNEIVAVSTQPEEDTSKLTCTLFEPTSNIDNDGFLYLTHVQSGKRVRTHSATSNRVCVVDDEVSDDLAFAWVDWDTLVKIPRRVTFKGDNVKYLQAGWDGQQYLEFTCSKPDDKKAAYNVHLHPDGYLRIKSEFYGKYWRLSGTPDNWIWADSSDISGTDVDTLFLPKKFGSSITLTNLGKDQYFCSRLASSQAGKVNCLNAAQVSQITKEAKFEVEELVLQRKISAVEYPEGNGRVFDEQPIQVGSGSATNSSAKETSLPVKITYTIASSYYFTNSFSINTDVKSTIQAGIPSIVDGKIVISPEVTNDSFLWGQPTESSEQKETTYTALNVPPWTTVTVKYLATSGKCSVPFSYTQHDQGSTDDRYIDGIFHGANYYTFRFDAHHEPPPKSS